MWKNNKQTNAAEMQSQNKSDGRWKRTENLKTPGKNTTTLIFKPINREQINGFCVYILRSCTFFLSLSLTLAVRFWEFRFLRFKSFVHILYDCFVFVILKIFFCRLFIVCHSISVYFLYQVARNHRMFSVGQIRCAFVIIEQNFFYTVMKMQ